MKSLLIFSLLLSSVIQLEEVVPPNSTYGICFGPDCDAE